jgi:hypothetical protein
MEGEFKPNRTHEDDFLVWKKEMGIVIMKVFPLQ